jgi:hypothetical protein
MLMIVYNEQCPDGCIETENGSRNWFCSECGKFKFLGINENEFHFIVGIFHQYPECCVRYFSYEDGRFSPSLGKGLTKEGSPYAQCPNCMSKGSESQFQSVPERL